MRNVLISVCEQMIAVIILSKLIFHCDYLGCCNSSAGKYVILCILNDLLCITAFDFCMLGLVGKLNIYVIFNIVSYIKLTSIINIAMILMHFLYGCEVEVGVKCNLRSPFLLYCVVYPSTATFWMEIIIMHCKE